MELSQHEFKKGGGVLFAAFIGLFFSVGTLVIYSFGLFAPELAKEFGWNRIETSFAITVFNYMLVISALLFGYLIDRFGAKHIILISILLFAPMYFLFANLNGSLVHFYLLFGLMALLSGGTLPVGYSRIIVGWFEKNRGLALGIALSGVGVGSTLLPPILQGIIDGWGWRSAAMVLAAGIILISFPITLFLLKNPPQADQQMATSHKGAINKKIVAILFLFSVLSGLFLIGALIHFVPILQSRGLEPAKAARFASLIGISVVLGRIMIGYLVDRFFAPRVIFFLYFAPVAAFFTLVFFSSDIAFLFAAMSFGLALGAEVDVIAYMVSRYFSADRFGKIYGLMFAGFTAGAANGPLVVGILSERTGDYKLGLLVLGVLTISAALTTFLLPRFSNQ